MNHTTVSGVDCVTGPDVSMYQPGVDFGAVRASGEAFAIIKATEGGGYLDPWCNRHANNARAAGIPFGFYHFAQPGNPIQQADWFSQIIRANPGWTMPPTLDAEVNGLSGDWVLQFCARVGANLGVAPQMVYTGAYVAFSRPQALTSLWLWLAAYTQNPLACPPWGLDWKMWQFTSSASVPGVPGRCDRSVARADWFAQIVGGTPPPPKPPEVEEMPATSTARNADGSLWVFSVHKDDAALLGSCQDGPGGSWPVPTWLGVAVSEVPTVAYSPDGRIELFARDVNGAQIHAWQAAPNDKSFGQWQPMGANIRP